MLNHCKSFCPKILPLFCGSSLALTLIPSKNKIFSRSRFYSGTLAGQDVAHAALPQRLPEGTIDVLIWPWSAGKAPAPIVSRWKWHFWGFAREVSGCRPAASPSAMCADAAAEAKGGGGSFVWAPELAPFWVGISLEPENGACQTALARWLMSPRYLRRHWGRNIELFLNRSAPAARETCVLQLKQNKKKTPMFESDNEFESSIRNSFFCFFCVICVPDVCRPRY